MLSLAAAAPLSFTAPVPAVVPMRSQVSMMAKSQALPFLEAPPALDGSMAGDVGFDPLNLSAQGGPKGLLWLREAELRHGRTAMLAVVGWIAVDSGLRFPAVAAATADFKSYQASYEGVVGAGVWGLIFTVGVIEIAQAGAIAFTLKGGDRAPGDYALTGGFGKTPEQMARLKLAEIKHCRLAMMAFSGIVTETALTDGVKDFPYF